MPLHVVKPCKPEVATRLTEYRIIAAAKDPRRDGFTPAEKRLMASDKALCAYVKKVQKQHTGLTFKFQ